MSDSCLPAEHFWVGVHDIQRLFKAPILNEADNFTVKGRQVVPVLMQNYGKQKKHVLTST